MAGPRVYIHEFIDIIGHHRAEYMYHMTANWVPIGLAERNQRCFGVWGVVGSTGSWPQVVNLWEYDDWAALAHNFEVEQRGAGLQDPSLARWWAEAATFRSGGVDRILVAPDWSPSVADLAERFERAGRAPAGYAHEQFRTEPGADVALLEAIREGAVGAHRAAGLTLVGAFRRAMADDSEVIVIWSFDDWATWGRFESAAEPLAVDGAAGGARRRENPVVSWRTSVAPIVRSCERILMADAPLSPLRLGRQPSETDRTA
ncbi:MAG: NIPSNAP family containing protein [Actinobacteria bacterium]|nr:NIPSNAP family containing protein [Actinomycetota bacterium]